MDKQRVIKNLDKTILLAGYDFEQEVQRGITFYSKSLVKALRDLGYKNYILTSAKNNKVNTVQELLISRKIDKPSSDKTNTIKLIMKYIKSFCMAPESRIIDRQFTQFDKNLAFLKNVYGYVNIGNIYDIISLQSRTLGTPYTLKVDDFDVVFCTSPLNMKVTKGCTLVQTLHDVSPLVRLEHPPLDSAILFHKRLKNMLRYSDVVCSVSEFSKNEILKIFPGYGDKIVVTHQPVPVYEDEEMLANDPFIKNSVLTKYSLNEKEYLLYIGMLEKRKNIEKLIEAYLTIKDKIKIPLVLVGALYYGQEDFIDYLTNKKYDAHIKYLKYVPTVDKLVLLKNANSFVFPSLYEGFGLPPIEAMRMGCPVLTSNVSALPEVCGDAALYVNPSNLASIIEGILEIVNNATLRDELVRKGYERSQYFNFNNYKQNLNNVLSNL